MATAVRDLSDELAKHNSAFKDGGPARAALHAIAGGLLGGVNGVDGAIKSAISAKKKYKVLAPSLPLTLSKLSIKRLHNLA